MAVIAKYKFNSTLYADLIPEFNAEFTNYTVTDEATETDSKGNVIKTRIIEHDTLLPTLMRFGQVYVVGETVSNASLSLLEVCQADTSNITDASAMFRNCRNIISVGELDTSNITNMYNMFSECYNLTLLDVSNWDTSNVMHMDYMFQNCKSLTSLDLSNFNTSNVTNFSNMFSNTPLLTDIGMLYCTPSTINTLSSNISTPSTNVWVEGSMIDELTSYDNVTYKAYYWEKEVLLNSPLLEGDKIVKRDGKLYHYHKMSKVVLDGSENWQKVGETVVDGLISKYYYPSDFPLSNTTSIKPYGKIFSNNLKTVTYTESLENVGIINANATFIIVKENDGVDIPQWLSENPTTVVYELATPYYELISDTSDDLSLSLVSEDNIISNNSLIPTNMNVKNNGMSTIAMQSSTKYTVAFDKDTDSSVTIDLCGSTIDTTDNVVEITTPSELANDEITFIGDCEISNVRILKGSVSGDAIPKESFEGLKSSFEDSRLPSNLVINGNVVSTSAIDYDVNNLVVGETYTINISLGNISTAAWCTVGFVNEEGNVWCGNFRVIEDYNNDLDVINLLIKIIATENANHFRISCDIANILEINNLAILKGDWTHLIEEDWNNLGKYKVEYKVVGKNKFNLASNIKHIGNNHSMITYINSSSILVSGISNVTIVTHIYLSSLLKEGVTYTMSIKGFDNIQCGIGYDNFYSAGKIRTFTYDGKQNIFIWFQGIQGIAHNTTVTFQLEEGTVATEYEPYKEYTKTFYLNSPLLEGDTIEDVNGVATHVKRYNKVVLDGSSDENWRMNTGALTEETRPNTRQFMTSIIDNSNVHNNPLGSKFCDKLNFNSVYGEDVEGIQLTSSAWDRIRIGSTIKSLDEFKTWLSQNPVTVVYQLASPQYEPISTESILCDSYVNGHLDVDSNIPVEKVKFGDWYKGLKYLLPSTDYTIQFQSDNKGLADDIGLGHWGIVLASNIVVSKGINVIKVTTPNELVVNMLYIRGIGFNASNIQVVATDRDNIGYFKGIQSSFEDKMIRSKNLFNKNNIVLNYGFGTDGSIINPSSIEHSTEYIECKPNTSYICNFGTGIHYFDENKTWISYQNHGTSSPSNAKYLVKCIGQTVDLNTVQIEEGKNITTYEPYGNKYEVKVTLEDENGVISNEFIYLNSPLLKGDRIEMYNGKLCHYHKMGMVVLDGSEGDMSQTVDGKWYRTSVDNGATQFVYYHALKKVGYNTSICDKFLNTGNSDPFTSGKRKVFTYTDHPDLDRIYFNFGTSDTSMQEWLTWLSENPTTIVYELLEPYYEDITPIQNEFVITSIGESSFTIDSGAIPTDGEITYSVNVKLLNDLEESINNNTSSTDTDLSTILDDIINE